MKVNVKGQADTYAPQPKVQTVDNGAVPEARNSIGNVDSLPPKTTFEWKNGAPNTAVDHPGEVDGTVVVHYPDGTSEEVTVKVNVRQSHENGIPEVQPALPEFAGGVNGGPEVQPTHPEFEGGVNGEPEEQPELPEFNGGVDGNPEVQPALPEFAGGVNGEPEVQPELPEFSGGVNTPDVPSRDIPEYTDPIGTSGTDGNGNTIEPPILNLSEFTGGVNGDPEIQSELPKYIGSVHNESEIRSNFRDTTSNIATKRLANTGQSQNNSELAGLGLAIVGLIAAMKRRKKEGK